MQNGVAECEKPRNVGQTWCYICRSQGLPARTLRTPNGNERARENTRRHRAVKRCPLKLQSSWVRLIISIKIGNDIGSGMLNRQIQCLPTSNAACRYKTNSRVLISKATGDSSSVVRGPVVHDDKLPIAHGLVPHTQ